jgi:hypothetical protein
MIELSRLFEVWFDDRKFSVAEVLAFSGATWPASR